MATKGSHLGPSQPARRRLERSLYLAFLLSGIAGLMHEVVWAKQLVQLIGATAYAQTVVLGVFMAGLALGAALFGRSVDRSGNAVRTYVILELVIALYCLTLPLLLGLAGQSYVALANLVFESGALKLMLRFVLATVAVLPPSICMGATLPVLARALIGHPEQTQQQVARLYALNSLGAVLGAGLAGFVLLPLYGIRASLGIAAGLNALAALVVLPLLRRSTLSSERESRKARSEASASYTSTQSWITLVALALSGMAAMGYEVVFLRVIAQAFGSSTYSFTIMLMCFVLGISLGSHLISRIETRQPLWWLGVSQLVAVGALVAVTPLVARLPYYLGLIRIACIDEPSGFVIYELGKAVLAFGVLIVPTTCLGFSFPLVARVQVRQSADVGRRVGTTYAWNTVGNVIGVVATALWLLPWLGLRDALHVNLALSLLAGSLILAVTPGLGAVRHALTAALIVAVLIPYFAFGLRWSESITHVVDHLRMRRGPDPDAEVAVQRSHESASYANWLARYLLVEGDQDTLWVREDAHNTVLVYSDDDSLRLAVNSKVDASTGGDLDTQLMLAHIPLFLRPEARDALIIGYGSGITVGSALLHPLRRIDVVEISAGVLEADRFFAPYNHYVQRDPRVHVYNDDGLSFLRTVPRRYDLVISEPSNPWIAGIGGLFTIEFFELARSQLNPGGVFVFWFHTYEQSEDVTQMIMRTVETVFPYYRAFSDDDFGNVIAVASDQPLKPSFPEMERRWQDPGIHQDIARLKLPNLLAFLAQHRITRDENTRITADGVVNTVDHQRLEYEAPRSFFRGEHSFFMEKFDPLLQEDTQRANLLLDDYIDWRLQQRSEGLAREIEAAERYFVEYGGYGATVAQSLHARLLRIPR